MLRMTAWLLLTLAVGAVQAGEILFCDPSHPKYEECQRQIERQRQDAVKAQQLQDARKLQDASVVRQTDWNLLSRARARKTLARISEARAVQIKGLGSRL